jgi:hypothetical protein
MSLLEKLRAILGSPSLSRGAQRYPDQRPRSPLLIERLEGRLCLSHAYLLITDGPRQNQILRFDGSTGAFIDTLVYRDNTQLADPDLGLISDGVGNVYADGYDSANVARFLVKDGSPNPAPGQGNADFIPPSSGGLNGVEGLAFGADGNFYVANQNDRTAFSGQGNVLEYKGTDGTFISQVVPTGDSGLSQANDLHFGPDGHLYVDSFDTGQLLRYDETTFAELPSAGRTGANFIDADTTHYVNGFGWGPDGSLYVSKIDFHYTNGYVDKYDGVTGDLLGTFIAADPTRIGTIDAIVWENGNLYITNKYSPQTTGVLEYDATGTFVRVFASDPSLLNPVGLVFCDPGAAASARVRNQTRSNGVVLQHAFSFSQAESDRLLGSTKPLTEVRAAFTATTPVPVQESPAAHLSLDAPGAVRLVAHPAAGDNVLEELQQAGSLVSRLTTSDLNLLPGWSFVPGSPVE